MPSIQVDATYHPAKSPPPRSLFFSTLTAVPGYVTALFKTALSLCLPYSIIAPPIQWDIDESKLFEGFYTRTLDYETGSTLAIIFCRINNAPTNPYLVHLSFTPSVRDAQVVPYQRAFFPNNYTATRSNVGWGIHVEGIGRFDYDRNADMIKYNISDGDEMQFECTISGRTAWDEKVPSRGPEASFAHLNSLLGQHWYVHSTLSSASYTLKRLGQATITGTGHAHVEKNNGFSFPTGWIWSQGFPNSSVSSSSSSSSAASKSVSTPRFSIAGGQVLPGVSAFLVGYRGRLVNFDFIPPSTMTFFGLFSLGTSATIESRKGRIELILADWTRRLEVQVTAPLSTFTLPLACPLMTGHTPNYAHESFEGVAKIRASTCRFFWNAWTVVEESEIQGCALEFGGDYSHWWNESSKIRMEEERKSM